MPSKEQPRFRRIEHIFWIILAANWSVATAKLIVGMMIGSAAMTADGAHSFSDGAGNLIGILGARIASRPKDPEHPYGRAKYETLASLGIAAMLLIVLYTIIQEAVARFRSPHSIETNVASFIVMLVTIVINIVVSTYEFRAGRKLQSATLTADALQTRSDIAVSLSVLGTLIGVRFGLLWLDPLATCVVALFIGRAAYQVVRAAVPALTDEARIDPKRVQEVALGVAGVRDCHMIRSRGREEDVFVDLHLLVDPQMSVGESHALASEVEKRIRETFEEVRDVVVHVEPDDHREPIAPMDEGQQPTSSA